MDKQQNEQTEFRIPDPDCPGFSWTSNPDTVLRYEIMDGKYVRVDTTSLRINCKPNPDWINCGDPILTKADYDFKPKASKGAKSSQD